MFKFNFISDENEVNVNEDENVVHKSENNWKQSEQIFPSNNNELTDFILKNAHVETITVHNNEKIKHLCPSSVLNILQSKQSTDNFSILEAELSNSDLLPGIYEGGLKIWECTYDLLNYLDAHKVSFQNKKVLDLGCGVGILGIYSLLKGATCHFQDYNTDVLQYITIPSTTLNIEDVSIQSKFYSGDWQSFSCLLENQISEEKNEFDYIFTSETIYNIDNYSKLHELFQKLLKKTGIIYLAAKSFYFGVGGGISLFQHCLDELKVFKYTSCWKSGSGIKREILKIEFNT